MDVNVERAEDVLTHKRLLGLAKDPALRPAFAVRAVQVRHTLSPGVLLLRSSTLDPRFRKECDRSLALVLDGSKFASAHRLYYSVLLVFYTATPCMV
jgi:hypothetical protein